MKAIVFGAKDRMTVRRAVNAKCQVVVEKGFRLLGEEAVDLSAKGMLLRSAESANLGDELIVSLRVPGTRVWIDAEAVIKRRVAGRRRGDRFQGYGIEFTRIDLLSRVMISTALKGCPPPVPQRSVRKDYARTIKRISEGFDFPILTELPLLNTPTLNWA